MKGPWLADVDPDEALDLADFPGLRGIGRMGRLVDRLPWFARLGAEIETDEVDWAQGYLAALGFPEAAVVPVSEWEEAADAAASIDLNSIAWEAEEQLRMALLDEALQRIDEASLTLALTHLASRAAEPIRAGAEAAAAAAGLFDEELILAAQGGAMQACHQAALVLAAEVEDEHAFALKFRLFEAGRWPIGLAGNSFNLF